MIVSRILERHRMAREAARYDAQAGLVERLLDVTAHDRLIVIDEALRAREIKKHEVDGILRLVERLELISGPRVGWNRQKHVRSRQGKFVHATTRLTPTDAVRLRLTGN